MSVVLLPAPAPTGWTLGAMTTSAPSSSTTTSRRFATRSLRRGCGPRPRWSSTSSTEPSARRSDVCSRAAPSSCSDCMSPWSGSSGCGGPGRHPGEAVGIPVVVADGTERQILEDLRLDRALALATLASSDTDNLAGGGGVPGGRPGRTPRHADRRECGDNRDRALPLGAVYDVASLTARHIADPVDAPAAPVRTTLLEGTP